MREELTEQQTELLDVARVRYVISLGAGTYFHDQANGHESVTLKWREAKIFNGMVGKKEADRLTSELKKKGWSAARCDRLI